MPDSEENGRPDGRAASGEEVQEAPARPPLDPEIEARRDAAFRLIRPFGDPVLRSRAGDVTRFDDSLREEVARMDRLMGDALGLGLAANQVGVLHRLFVYRAGPDAPLVAVVNPRLEWSSQDEETAEEGCLSLPRVTVDVERPVHVRVSARDERGEADHDRGVGARGARDPARDGPPRRCADPRPHHARPAQGGAARPARGRGARSRRGRCRRGRRRRRRRSVRTVYLGSSVFAVDVLGALAASPHAPVLVVTPPDRPQGRGRRTAPPPAAVAARELGLPVLQAESVNEPEAVAAIADAAPDVVGVCEFGQLIREPLLSQYTDAERAPVAASALARRGADRARADGRATPSPA